MTRPRKLARIFRPPLIATKLPQNLKLFERKKSTRRIDKWRPQTLLIEFQHSLGLSAGFFTGRPPTKRPVSGAGTGSRNGQTLSQCTTPAINRLSKGALFYPGLSDRAYLSTLRARTFAASSATTWRVPVVEWCAPSTYLERDCGLCVPNRHTMMDRPGGKSPRPSHRALRRKQHL